MRVKFKCENCGNEVEFGEGRISLVCQGCGCYHLKFNTPILVSSVLPSEEIGLTTLIEKDSSFFGSHGNSAVWEVKLPAIEPVVIEEMVLSPLPTEEKEKEDLEEAKKAEKEKLKKPTLLKTARKLGSRFGK